MSAFHSLSLHSTRIEARDTLVVRFDVPEYLREVFHFTQGQYLTLRTSIENEEVRRSYSICSAVQDGVLEVAIKKIQDGLFSNWAAQHLQAGVAIDVMPPMGKFSHLLHRKIKNTISPSVQAAVSHRFTPSLKPRY